MYNELFKDFIINDLQKAKTVDDLKVVLERLITSLPTKKENNK